MIKYATAALFTIVVAATSLATAATYTWNTAATGLNPGSGTNCAGTGVNAVACQTTFSSAGQTLIARAYSTPVYDTAAPFDVSGKWMEAQIAVYSGNGIGVRNLNPSDTVSEGSVPEHAIDNLGVKDLVVFELPTGVWDPVSFALGYANTDSDIQAWVGGANLGANYDFRNACFAGTGCSQLVNDLGFVNISDGMAAVTGGTVSPGGASGAGGMNVPTGVAAPFATTPNATGRYLIISGNLGCVQANPDPNHYGCVGSNGTTADNDFFKISALTAATTPPTGVPIPSVLYLVGLGLLTMGRVRSSRA